MLITKKLIPSMSMVEDSQIDELRWLIKNTSEVLSKTYDREVVYFEHGMCSCVGGLDRAHLHFMTIKKTLNSEQIRNAINKVLIKRRAGIESVEIKGQKLDNIHDITHIMESSDPKFYKIHGKQVEYKNIYNDINIDEWPISTRPHSNSGGHYVYFKTKDSESSFLTNKNFQTQLGRQIVFELELETNKEMKNFYEKEIKKNSYANVWKWQEFPFKENMAKTMSDLIPSFLNVQKKKDNHNFITFDKI